MVASPREKLKPVESSLTLTRVQGGYQVHSGSKTYLVTFDANDTLICSCPDFLKHRHDTRYRCKHMVAVLEDFAARTASAEQRDEQSSPNSEPSLDVAGEPSPVQSAVQPRVQIRDESRMLIKRSMSNDGRIDCVSVEIEFGLAAFTLTQIKDKALVALKLQQDIAKDFLDSLADGITNSKGIYPQPVFTAPNAAPDPSADATLTPLAALPVHLQSPVPAKLLTVGVTQSQWGMRYFITVDIGGKTAKLFGTQKQLAKHIAQAGYMIPAERIDEGMSLNISCKVTVKPSNDGRYLNIESVFPA